MLTKATALHSDLNLARRMLAVAEQNLAMQEQLIKKGQAAVEGMLTAQVMVEKHRGEVEKLQTELKSLRGEFAVSPNSFLLGVALSPNGRLLATTGTDQQIRLWDASTGQSMDRVWSTQLLSTWLDAPKPAIVQASMSDRVKKLLDQEVEMRMQGIEIPAVFEELMKLAKADMAFRVVLGKQQMAAVDLKGKLTVGAWLQAIEDTDPNIRIVVRDYGLLLTTRAGVPEAPCGCRICGRGNTPKRIRRTQRPQRRNKRSLIRFTIRHRLAFEPLARTLNEFTLFPAHDIHPRR